MRSVRWLRVASLLLGALPGLLGGCTVSDDPPPSLAHDLSMNGGPGSGDMGSVLQGDMMRPPGAIGAACTASSDCKFGSSPTCFTQNFLNMPGEAATPGGYCSASCTADSNCAGQGICVTLLQGSPNYCIATCAGPNSCRHPDYACFVLTASSGYCWPSGTLSCNPTAGTGECLASSNGTQVPGGCIRRAFEDLGECRQKCNFGPGQCPPLGQDKQHCVYINAQLDTSGNMTRDRFKGSACFLLDPVNAKPEGSTCAYLDECQDGLECNLTPGGDRKCHFLCQVGVVGGCSDPNQKCKDVFQAGLGNPGLCL